jgi:hypothetical protein
MPTTPRIETTYARSGSVSAVRHGDRVVLMDLSGEEFYSLDGVAGRMWELLSQPISSGLLADRLAAEYDAPLETIREDVLECLAQLDREGLVRVVR